MSAPLTVEGAKLLNEELDRLKGGRVERSQAIGEARKLGDLKENADYHAAKDRQGLIEARIRYLESRLTGARVIDVKQIKNTGKVIFGTTVTIEKVDSSEPVTYRIVGEDESDVKNGTISNVSPLAKAMLGKSTNEFFYVGEGENETEYLITRVEHL